MSAWIYKSIAICNVDVFLFNVGAYCHLNTIFKKTDDGWFLDCFYSLEKCAGASSAESLHLSHDDDVCVQILIQV